MRVLITKKLSTSDMDLVKMWAWDFVIKETLKIIPVEVNEIPQAEVWIASSRNSFPVLKKFINRAPGIIYCVGKWMKEELEKIRATSTIRSFETMSNLVNGLAKQDFKTILYFCGEEHRQELEDGMKDFSVKILKVITHQSQMTFPVVNNEFDAVFIFSPRSAESLLKNNSFASKTTFACIGSTTASYLNSRGITNTFTPSHPDSRILLEEFHNQILNVKS